jgi:hypothetical protein
MPVLLHALPLQHRLKLTIMKKCLIMLLGAILASFVFAPSVRGDEDVNIIIVDPNAPGAEVLHRDASVPITCTLSSNCLYVTFLESLGSTSVEIENHTTGEYNQTVVNAQIGSTVFPISGTAGQWSITFTLSNGTIYYGETTI